MLGVETGRLTLESLDNGDVPLVLHLHPPGPHITHAQTPAEWSGCQWKTEQVGASTGPSVRIRTADDRQVGFFKIGPYASRRPRCGCSQRLLSVNCQPLGELSEEQRTVLLSRCLLLNTVPIDFVLIPEILTVGLPHTCRLTTLHFFPVSQFSGDFRQKQSGATLPRSDCRVCNK